MIWGTSKRRKYLHFRIYSGRCGLSGKCLTFPWLRQPICGESKIVEPLLNLAAMPPGLKLIGGIAAKYQALIGKAQLFRK